MVEERNCPQEQWLSTCSALGAVGSTWVPCSPEQGPEAHAWAGPRATVPLCGPDGSLS